jgi:hypothetical protein
MGIRQRLAIINVLLAVAQPTARAFGSKASCGSRAAFYAAELFYQSFQRLGFDAT